MNNPTTVPLSHCLFLVVKIDFEKSVTHHPCKSINRNHDLNGFLRKYNFIVVLIEYGQFINGIIEITTLTWKLSTVCLIYLRWL